MFGDTSNIYGGTTGALHTDFPTSVNNVFRSPPKAAMVMEGDFVPGVATVKATPVTDYNVFAFPSINGSGPEVEIGGDTIVAFRDTPAIEAFVKFLTTPQAAAAWARHGGFATGNKNMSPSAYPDAITRSTAAPVASATTVVFDMSDQQPASFGATAGQGEWGLFQAFLRNPKRVNGTAANWRLRRPLRTRSDASALTDARITAARTGGLTWGSSPVVGARARGGRPVWMLLSVPRSGCGGVERSAGGVWSWRGGRRGAGGL